MWLVDLLASQALFDQGEFAQGYLFSRPLLRDEMSALIDKNPSW